MFSYVWPIALVVLSNIFYQICTKSVPRGMDPLASLTVTYLVGAGLSAYLAGAASAGARAARAALSFARRVFQPFSEQAGSSLWLLPSV